MILRYVKKCSGLIYLLPVIIFFNINCGQKKAEQSKELNLADLDTVAVKTAQSVVSNIKLIKTFTGTLEGEDQANVVSKIPERITDIKVRVGDRVDAGQLLITLDKVGASSQFYQAQAAYLNAEKERDRMQALFKEGAISQQMFDGTKTAYEVAKANFDAAKSTVELTSPISGIVTAINPNIGDLANPGVVLMTIANINKMKVLFDIGEADVPNFAIGQNVEVYSELKPELIQKGTISQISKSADIQSRSFEIRAAFSNTSGSWFKPGMFCRVNVELKNKKDVIVVPSQAVIVNQNNSGVYVINNGRAYLRNVIPGINNGRMTEISSGLKKGETVITLGTNKLKEGSVVHISD